MALYCGDDIHNVRFSPGPGCYGAKAGAINHTGTAGSRGEIFPRSFVHLLQHVPPESNGVDCQ
ncbi:MAG TPA: hypothetical protein VKY19_22135 [Ktedonosporobacter sp.]|nr:hypothetical protein [Ktedonosporobacter sp.]